MGRRWVPLESNPDVLNSYAKSLGARTGQAAFVDVLGMDDELLMMVPQPVEAVVMLYPINEATETLRAQDNARLEDTSSADAPTPEAVWFTKQTVSNACGTVALLHAFANAGSDLVDPDSFLAKFLESTKGKSPAERARMLEEPAPGEPDIEEAHQSAAGLGQTAPPAPDEAVDLHFVCFVHKDGELYELDGRRNGPVKHGASSAASLLKDTCAVVKHYIELANSMQFTMVALAPVG